MGRCTAPAESAARWTTRPTALHGPSCRERSPPSSALVQHQQDLHQQLHLDQVQGRELLQHLDQGMELQEQLAVEEEAETSLLKKRERRDGASDGDKDRRQQQSWIQYNKGCLHWTAEGPRRETQQPTKTEILHDTGSDSSNSEFRSCCFFPIKISFLS
ncbi:hypothetical protein ILYODFUR_017839 [Ilyodon furcidens]|uniref:Uncharacterized protein n=1 Tax=Ilyodon furcidens TaxID=33524 RepID=A0ABV0SMZ3_9TELE